MPPYEMAAEKHSSLILNTIWEKVLNPVLKNADGSFQNVFTKNAHRQNSIIPALRCMVISNNQCNLRPICTIPGKCRSFESVNYLHPYIKSSKKGEHYNYYNTSCCSVFYAGPVPKFWRLFFSRTIYISFCCITSYNDTCQVRIFKNE